MPTVYLGDLMELVDNINNLYVWFVDPNMNMDRTIENETLDRYRQSYANCKIIGIRADGGKIKVQIVKPN